YIETITNYIIANHSRKTHNRAFTAMFCVSSIEILIKYYELFKAKKTAGEHRLNIATIFSYSSIEKAKEDDGFIHEEDFESAFEETQNLAAEPNETYRIYSRDKLDEFIDDYNTQFQSKHSAKDGNTFLN